MQLLVDYLSALDPLDTQEAWETAAELVKRSFPTTPPPAVSAQLHESCLLLPVERDALFWSVCRAIPPDVCPSLARMWLLRHRPLTVAQLERAATSLQQFGCGGHADALDFLRWAETARMREPHVDRDRWRALYFQVLRHTAEERVAATMHRGAALDLSTEELRADERIVDFGPYTSQLTGEELTLRYVTETECALPSPASVIDATSADAGGSPACPP